MFSMSLFSGAKDKALQYAALTYLNSKLLAPYGRATELQIDSRAQTLRIILELKGEASPIELEITEYQILQETGRYFALVKSARTSREWLTTLAREELCNRRLELGPNIGPLLMKLV